MKNQLLYLIDVVAEVIARLLGLLDQQQSTRDTGDYWDYEMYANVDQDYLP